MTRIRIADRIAHAMIADNYGSVIMWGDGMLNDAVGDYITGRMANHPLNRMIAALNALERAPDLFKKGWTIAHDSRCHQRRVRSFRLIGTPRPLENDQ